MTDDLELNASQDGQVVATPAAASGAEDQPISRAEFLKGLDALGEKLSQQVQSLSDKASARLRKDVSDKLAKTIDEIGKEQKLDDDQIADLKKDFIHEEVAAYNKETPETGRQPASRRASEPDQKAIDEVNTWMRDRSDNAGIPLFDVDPEFATVDWTSPPDKFMEQFEAALSAKAKRLGREFPTPPAAPNRSPGSISGGMAGNRVEQLNKRLIDIQEQDPFSRNATMTKERKEVLRELKALE